MQALKEIEKYGTLPEFACYLWEGAQANTLCIDSILVYVLPKRARLFTKVSIVVAQGRKLWAPSEGRCRYLVRSDLAKQTW